MRSCYESLAKRPSRRTRERARCSKDRSGPRRGLRSPSTRHGRELMTVYHPGELAVQERAGVRAGAAKIGASIDAVIEPAPAHFLAQRYTLYVGSLDAGVRPWG